MNTKSLILGDAVSAESSRLRPILDRYDTLLSRVTPQVLQEPDPGTSPQHLRWMIHVLMGNIQPFDNGKLTPLKMHRWLGFIQGTMISHGVLTVPQERELTRGLLTEH